MKNYILLLIMLTVATDAFQPSYRKPYYDMLINTEDNVTNLPPENNYNSNCQFGVCLPGNEANEEGIE